MSPERSLHPIVHPQRPILRDRLLDHIARTRIRARLVLQPDLDEFEGGDDEGLGGSCGATGDNRQGLSHGLSAVVGESVAPVGIGGDCGMSQRGLRNGGRMSTYT